MTIKRITRTLLAVVTALACSAAGAVTPAQASGTADWPQEGFGPGSNGFNPAETKLTATRVHGLRERWSAADSGAGCGMRFAPVTSDGRLFVTGRTGVTGYGATTGRKLWSFRYEDPLDTTVLSLGVDGGTLLFGTANCKATSDPHGELIALDTGTGAVRWRKKLESPILNMVIDHGVVIVTGAENDQATASAFGTRNGQKKWDLGGWISGGTVADGTLLVYKTDLSSARAVDVRTGRARWSAKNLWAFAGDPTGKSFIVNDLTGKLQRVDAATGKPIWSVKGDTTFFAAVDFDRVYLSSFPANKITVLDLRTGKKVWQRKQPGFFAPTVAGGVLWAVFVGNRIRAIDPATGADFDAADAVEKLKPIDRVVVADGWLYATDGTTLRAFSTR